MLRVVWCLLALSACGSGGAKGEPAKTPLGVQPGTPQGAAEPARVDENRFFSPVAGVSVEKRPSWHFMPLDLELANRKAVSVGREDTDAAMHESTVPPLVVIARYEEPSAKPNPTLKINLRGVGDLRGSSAVSMTRVVADLMAQAIPSFALDGDVQATQVSGLDAGTFRAHFMLQAPQLERSFAIKTRAWIVPRGDYAFVIAASDPSGGAEDYEADFQAMVATIVIQHQEPAR